MIKGYKHLQECAYIGDDSSEELDELLEAHKLGLLSNTTLLEKITQLNKEDGKANDPGKYITQFWITNYLVILIFLKSNKIYTFILKYSAL